MKTFEEKEKQEKQNMNNTRSLEMDSFSERSRAISCWGLVRRWNGSFGDNLERLVASLQFYEDKSLRVLESTNTGP